MTIYRKTDAEFSSDGKGTYMCVPLQLALIAAADGESRALVVDLETKDGVVIGAELFEVSKPSGHRKPSEVLLDYVSASTHRVDTRDSVKNRWYVNGKVDCDLSFAIGRKPEDVPEADLMDAIRKVIS